MHDVIPLQPICVMCQGYFERIPSIEEFPSFVEMRCECRTKVLHVDMQFKAIESCDSVVQQSVLMNGLFDIPLMETGVGRYAKSVVDVRTMLVGLRNVTEGVGEGKRAILTFLQKEVSKS
jgi:hypothetical protein